MVTLSRDPARYSFLRALDCTIWSSDTKAPDERITPHRILDLKEDDLATQFPSRMYAMTSMSHLLIHDGSPSLLNLEQQQAVIDWLHFGGTIVINGIDGLDRVESSFLREYSPIANTSTSTWSDEDSATINDVWTIPRVNDPSPIPFTPLRAFPKLTGQLTEGSRWIETLEGLVAERMIGRGRIVLTTFSMNEPSFLRWPSYSSLVHNAILRMPSRTVSKPESESTPTAPVNSNAPIGSSTIGELDFVPALDTVYSGDYQGTELNPLHSTRLRIWARDLDSSTSFKRIKEQGNDPQGNLLGASSLFPSERKQASALELVIICPIERERESGRIIRNYRPKIRTIVWLLLGYLIILVPINWAVFRLTGKVEYAWVMAPIIAVVGAFVVARKRPIGRWILAQ